MPSLFKAPQMALMRNLLCTTLLFLTPSGFCDSKLTSAQKIQQLYDDTFQASLMDQPLGTQLNLISLRFLNHPYEGNALGEGPSGQFDQFPFFREDAFDCETFVDTVMAIALSHDFETFKTRVRAIRYDTGQVDFVHRNHFASLDWNPNNQKAGFTKDITRQILDQNGKSVTKIASAVVDKPNWYAHLPASRIRLPHAPKSEQQAKLKALQKLGQSLPISTAQIDYIPLDALFDQNANPNTFLFAQIPDGAIVEIIRPNWDLVDQIGTHLNVSHLGFAFQTATGIRFRHASITQQKVVDVSLIEYLKNTLKSPTIKGINVQMVLPPK